MEYIDIIDKKGNKTGEIKPKDEVHKNGLWHGTVHLWCINDRDEILLQKRSPNKENFPNMWDISVAGHISSGEEVISAVLREAKEEIGVDFNVNNLEFLGNVEQNFILNNGMYIDNELNYIYLVKTNLRLENLNMQKDEVEQLQWIPIIEFKKWVDEEKTDLIPHIEEYRILLNRLNK